MKRTFAFASAALLLTAGTPGALAQAGDKPLAAQPPAGQPPAAQPKPAAQPPKEDKAELKLKVGDPAPTLKIDTWVKGDSVLSYERNKIYVLVFWSTTSKQSVDEVPHLTDLQKKFKDAVIVGVAGPGHGEVMGDKRLEDVEKFVKDMGEKIGYRIGFDATGMTFKPYMSAAGRNALPTAFVVDGSTKIAWIGNPKDLDKELERLTGAGLPKEPKKNPGEN